MRQLTEIEISRVKVLTENSVSFTLIEPTATGLKKSILDATGSVRNYLKNNSIHDYSLQKQGPENKIIIDAILYEDYSIVNSRTSLYRPKTKKGDPRIWFTKLKKITKSNDILAIIVYNGKLHIINITQQAIEKLVYSIVLNPIKELIQQINSDKNLIAMELLGKLKIIAKKGFIPALVDADTAVGRTLETELGIKINSSKTPDYKGIEIKSYRKKKKGRENRKQLFTKVANWKISKFKSSAQILENFGYIADNGLLKLYCTLSTQNVIPQGLSLRVDSDLNLLYEHSNKKEIGDFLIWKLETLHQGLLKKHKETFWVSALTKKDKGKEYFQYDKVEHTKNPITSQFDLLLEQGRITLDHLIKRTAQGGVGEKGPSFKIYANSLNLLFPPSQHYDLLA